MMSDSFYAFKCPSCGYWGAKEVRISLDKSAFKCKMCAKNTKIRKKTGPGISMIFKGPFDTPQEATTTVQVCNGVKSPQMLEIYESKAK